LRAYRITPANDERRRPLAGPDRALRGIDGRDVDGVQALLHIQEFGAGASADKIIARKTGGGFIQIRLGKGINRAIASRLTGRDGVNVSAGSCSRSAALGEYHQAARLSPAILHRVCGDGEAHGGNQQAGRTPDRCPEPRIPHHFALLRSMAWGRRAASIVQ
jgi:hypothetical protein